MLSFLRALNQAAARRPALSAVAIGGTKNLVCDVAVQTTTSGLDGLDTRRAGLFTAFGLVYVGGVQFVVFNRLFPALLPGLVNQERMVRSRGRPAALSPSHKCHLARAGCGGCRLLGQLRAHPLLLPADFLLYARVL